MKYVPMSFSDIAKIVENADVTYASDYEFFQIAEQAVLARIEAQGLVVVPKDDAERVELLNVLRHHIEYGDYQASQQDLLVRLHMHLEKGGA